MQPKAIFLDLDHTLCDTAKADELGVLHFSQILFEAKPDHPLVECQNLVRHFMTLLYKNPDELTRTENEDENHYRARLLQWTLNKKLPGHVELESCSNWIIELMRSRIEHFDFFEGTTQLLKKWRKKYRLVVITNGPIYSQRPKVERVDLSQHVDRVVLAGDHPWQKPDARLFQWALEQENLEPDQVIHVGDSLGSDIAGAINANIPNVWVNPSLRHGPREPNPNHVIPHINDLDGVLEKLG
jgi:HAD superfamily hydrolase (TIGR01549 family)